MNIYRDMIEEMVQEQKTILSRYTREYESCIDGNLACCVNRGSRHYYHTVNKDGMYVRRTINKDTKTLADLARKEYLRVAIPELRKSLDVMERTACHMEDFDAAVLKQKMKKAYLSLPEEYFYNGNGIEGRLLDSVDERLKRHEKWACEEYAKSDYMPESRKYMTSAGFRVRSKSEQHIVEQLVNYGVPFRYEQIISINRTNYSADFTFEDRYRQWFFWEHAGMMDVPSYADAHKRKISIFESEGIVPWKNLIVTYDVNGGINIPMIKSIIENEVIPRL